MRTKRTATNIIIGLSSLLISTICSFVLRTIFIHKLGETYLGVNGLLSNILSMLSLAELGVGTAIGFSLYKPLANNDEKKIAALMQYYKKTYLIIGLIVFAIGLTVTPFLHFFIKESEMVPKFYLIYIIYLVNTSYSYLFSYKRTLVFADQKSYLLNIYDTSFRLITVIGQILYLFLYNDYIGYLLISFVVTLIQNIVVNSRINKNYSYLDKYKKSKLNKQEKKDIYKNINGLIYHKVGNYLVNGTDNIIISKFVSIATVGLYSNYLLIVNTVNNFLITIIGSATASFGNLITSESKEKVYDRFKIYNFFGFWLYGFAAIAFYFLLNPFITLWIGEKFTFSTLIVLIIVLNFYFNAMLSTLDNVKSSAGIYYQDKYVPVIQAVVNLVVSIVLVLKLGILGVFIGTLVSIMVIFIWRPYFVYKYAFNTNSKEYFISFLKYALIILFESVIVYLIFTYLLTKGGLLFFIFKVIVVAIIPNLCNYLLFRNTNEFKELVGIIKFVLTKKKEVNNG